VTRRAKKPTDDRAGGKDGWEVKVRACLSVKCLVCGRDRRDQTSKAKGNGKVKGSMNKMDVLRLEAKR
jgi:hypothetical protein